MQNKQKGSILIIFVIAIIPILLMIGAAVDLSRVAVIKDKAQYALDLAGLAMVNSDKSLSNKILKDYFYANYQDKNNGNKHFGETLSLSYKFQTKDVLALSATIKIKTMFLNIVGIDDVEIVLKSTIAKENTGIELVMVLDNTRSMSYDDKLKTLKKVSRDFTKFLFDGKAINHKVKVGLVPFADNVNVGTSNSVFPKKYLKIRAGGFSGNIWKRSSDIWRSDTRDSISPKWESLTNAECFLSCVRTPILPLTNIRSKVLNRLDQMSAAGGTDVHLGAAWGWRVLSSKAPYIIGAPKFDKEWKKFLVLLTDGENIPSNHPGYKGRFIGEDWNAALTRTCDNIKREDIKIFTIGFDIATPKILKLLENCASSAEYYYNANNKTALKRAFDDIKKELFNVVVTK
jgi:Flp pilus assembly protein TadG